MATNDPPEVLARFHAELALVELAARQVLGRAGRSVTLDDLRSFGREGLLQAARTFDERHGVPFRRWANMRVKGAMLDGVRQWASLPRKVYQEMRGVEAADHVLATYEEQDEKQPASSPEAADDRLGSYLAGMATAIAFGTMVGAPRDEVGDDGKSITPEDRLGEAETLALVRSVVAKLPDQERALIERHYFEGETLEKAAAGIGLSKSWGSRLHARAIESIADLLRAERR
ncbi:MAG TPA: sigma-70 family RNA polymerase sigma factor [Polyangiaceae bacterium]